MFIIFYGIMAAGAVISGNFSTEKPSNSSSR